MALNRNSKKEIKKDVSFLKEMIECLGTYNEDIMSSEKLKTMLTDWKDELSGLLTPQR